MPERIQRTGHETIDSSNRLAKDYDAKGRPHLKEYSPSGTEELLEDICRSFQTELGQAEINPVSGTKLVRVSRPVVVTSLHTQENSLLAMQYTRFSPFRDSTKLVDAYRENAGAHQNKSYEEIMEEIFQKAKANHGGVRNPFKEVTQNDYIPDAEIARWEKVLYFSVFKLNDGEVPKEPVVPFTIHDGGEFAKRPPDIHIALSRAPLFFRHGFKEDDRKTTDQLYVDFPRIHQKHDIAYRSAMSLHPINKTGNEESDDKDEKFFKARAGIRQASYEIPSSTPRELTMGFIQAYLRKMCVGSTL